MNKLYIVAKKMSGMEIQRNWQKGKLCLFLFFYNNFTLKIAWMCFGVERSKPISTPISDTFQAFNSFVTTICIGGAHACVP